MMKMTDTSSISRLHRSIFVSSAMLMCSIMPSAAAVPVSAADELKAYTAPESSPANPGGMTFMPDGKQYAELSQDCKKIVLRDVRSGEETSVLFDVANARETTLHAIEGFTLSRDASKILVWIGSEPVYRRSTTASYYVYEVRSRLLKPLSTTHSVQQSPLFSPDSRMVAFVAENNIYVAKLDYGTEVAVTTDGERNSVINGIPDWTYEEEFGQTCSMTWAPDNLTLCYLRYDEKAVPTYTLPIYEGTCDAHKDYALYPGVFSYKYPVAGETNSTVSLHSYDIETRKIKDLALPDSKIEYIPVIKYGPDASSLMVATLNREQNRFELYKVNPKSTVVKSIYVDESKGWIDEKAYRDISYGETEFVVNSTRSGYNHLYAYSYAGAPVRTLTSGNFDVTDYYGADALGNYYYQCAAPTPMDRTVVRVDRKGVKTVISAADGTNSAEFAPGMDVFRLCHSDIDTPPVYTLCKADNGKSLRVIEDNSAYASRTASMKAQKEFFTMTSAGNTLNGYIVKPRDFNPSKKYPVIMSQYSGPGSQSVLNRWSLDWEQYFANNGYVIVCVDGRGTGGRGTEFMFSVYKNLGYYETRDQIAAAHHVASLPYVDANRIGIYGWSFGGYESLMCATAEDSPFAASAAIAPVTDWKYYDTVYTERYMLTPQQNFKGYLDSAPLYRADKLACPLLIMYGTADDNVHPANSLQFVSRLQSEGLLCDMFVFPNMNHSINGCDARSVVWARMFDFFNRNLK